MNNYLDIPSLTKAHELIPAQSLSSTAGTATYEASKADLITSPRGTALAILSAGAMGSGNTCVVTIEHADDDAFSENLATVATFTTVGNTASFQQKAIVLGKIKRYVRAKTVTTGTTLVGEIALVLLTGGYQQLPAA